MKAWIATAAALTLLTGISVASAQNQPTGTSNKSDKTTMQPQQGASTSTMSSKTSAKKSAKNISNKKSTKKMSAMSRKSAASKRLARHKPSTEPSSTTGAGSHEGVIGGPRNDPSIHQSFGHDSRGTPKDNGKSE